MYIVADHVFKHVKVSRVIESARWPAKISRYCMVIYMYLPYKCQWSEWALAYAYMYVCYDVDISRRRRLQFKCTF